MINDKIEAGTVMVQDSVLLPQALHPETEPFFGTWRMVKGLDGFGFDRGMRDVGWNFIFVEGRIKVLVVGLHKNKMLKRAARRFLAIVKSRWFNSAEISNVASGFFLGIPYLALSGHSRQIQESTQLLDAGQRKQAQNGAAWDCR